MEFAKVLYSDISETACKKTLLVEGNVCRSFLSKTSSWAFVWSLSWVNRSQTSKRRKNGPTRVNFSNRVRAGSPREDHYFLKSLCLEFFGHPLSVFALLSYWDQKSSIFLTLLVTGLSFVTCDSDLPRWPSRCLITSFSDVF